MHNKVNNTRKEISNLYKAINKVNRIKAFRSDFIANPSSAMETVESVDGLHEEILTYKEIFKSDVNSLVASEDAADVISASLLSSIDELAVTEGLVIPTINDIITKVTDVIGTMSDDRMGVVANGLTKANSALPYKELFSKKLERSLGAIMSKEGVASEEYLPWLYGIYKELEHDNISELLESPEFAAIEKYLNTATPVSLLKEHTYAPAVPVYEGSNKYGLIANYIVKPDSAISGLDVLIAIGSLLVKGEHTAAASSFGYTFGDISTVAKYRDGIAKSLEDSLADTVPDLDKLLTEIPQVAHKLTRVADRVIYECTDVYSELYKRVVMFLLLVDITASNNT